MENNDSLPDKKNPLITSTLEDLQDKHLGPIGTTKRDAYEKQLAEEVAKVEDERQQTIDGIRDALRMYIQYAPHQCNAAILVYNEFVYPLEEKLREKEGELFSCQQLCVYNNNMNMKTIQQQQAYIIELEQKLPKK